MIKPLQKLGLSKNEADVYRALLEIGQATVGQISKASKVHRRNVYDVLNRLIEKGLVFVVLAGKENNYQAVNPNKLMEFVQEEKKALNSIMPNLQKLIKGKPLTEEVMVYRGIDGWRRYIRDIIRVGEDVCVIGAKAAWVDERLRPITELFFREAEKRKITMHLLFDYELKAEKTRLIEPFMSHKLYKCAFLPEGYSTPSMVEVFGDYVVILSNMDIGKIADDTLFTVIINQEIADAFRVWFGLMWELCSCKKIK